MLNTITHIFTYFAFSQVIASFTLDQTDFLTTPDDSQRHHHIDTANHTKLILSTEL